MTILAGDHVPLPPSEPDDPYWRRVPLAAMTDAEWEGLCDGCGKCCLEKIAEPDGTISFTDVGCRWLDLETARCHCYPDRGRREPQCERLTAGNVPRLSWLPRSCGYRLVAEGRDLPWWHPLRSGDRELVHRLGLSVRGRAVRPSRWRRLEHRLVSWPA